MSLLGAIGGIGRGVMIGAEEIRRQDEANERKELARQQKEDRTKQAGSDAAYTESQKEVGTNRLDTTAPNYAGANDAVQNLTAQAPYGTNGVAFDPSNPEHSAYADKLTASSKAIPQTKTVTGADAARNFAANPNATAKDARAATDRAYALDAADAAVVERKARADIAAVQTGVMKLMQARKLGRLSDDDAVTQLQALSGVIPDGSTLTETVGKDGVAMLNYGDGKVMRASVPRTAESIDKLLESVLSGTSVEMMTAALTRKHADDVLAATVKYHTDSTQIQRERLAQDAKDAAASRGIQGAHLSLQRAQLDAGTPAGQIASKEKALGRALTTDEKTTLLGVDTMPQATKLRLTSLLKEQDQLATATNKAQAEGTWQPDTAGGKAIIARAAVLNQQVADLLDKAKPDAAKTGADPLGRNPVAGTDKSLAAPTEKPKLIAAPGGISTVERDNRIKQMNSLSGTSTARRDSAIETATADVAKNFDVQLDGIKRGASREDAFKALAWFDDNADYLSNEQRKQLKAARLTAGL